MTTNATPSRMIFRLTGSLLCAASSANFIYEAFEKASTGDYKVAIIEGVSASILGLVGLDVCRDTIRDIIDYKKS